MLSSPNIRFGNEKGIKQKQINFVLELAKLVKRDFQ